MAGAIDSLKTINSVARTFLAFVVVGVAGIAGWSGYTTYNAKEIEARKRTQELAAATEKLEETKRDLEVKVEQLKEKEEQIVSLNDELQVKEEEIQRLAAAMRLLKFDHRVARLRVLDQTPGEKDGEVITQVEFVELNDEGLPIDKPKRFTIKGEVVYIDNWVVKFEDTYIETADIDRSTSLVLFRRIFGEQQEPRDGFVLDETQGPPKAYSRGGVVTEFEKRIWSDFWNIANDEAKAKELGIRAAHGEAVSIKAEKGKTYKLLLRASDGLSIAPDENAPKPVEPLM